MKGRFSLPSAEILPVYCSEIFLGKMDFWENMEYPILYFCELAKFWRKFRVIRSLVSWVMDDLAGEVKSAGQQDQQVIMEFYWFLYLELGLLNLQKWNRHVEDHVEKVSKFYK